MLQWYSQCCAFGIITQKLSASAQMFAQTGSCSESNSGHDSSDGESWRGEVGLGTEREDTRLSCAAGGDAWRAANHLPCSVRAAFLFHWLLHVGCMYAET